MRPARRHLPIPPLPGRVDREAPPPPPARWTGTVGQPPPGRYGGGGAGTTWLVGSPDDVTAALRRYADLGVRHVVLSDTPYERVTAHVGDALIVRLRDAVPAPVAVRR
jgi:alkanesulfonate monooxygenase SsuD/methylene tetrahydromethanopterin reductase-like flavin-dependent oxidoreductase (luciferase family)